MNLDGTWKLAAPQSTLTPVGGGQAPFTDAGKAEYEQNKNKAAGGDYSFDLTMMRCSAPEQDESFPEDVCLDRKNAGQAPLPH